LLRDVLGAHAICGVDESSRTIEHARRTHVGEGMSFAVTNGYRADSPFDVAYTNGVFHHIPPKERPATISFLHGVLRPGGVLSFWENNPWSLGARYVMSKIPFDRDAIMVSAAEARRLLRAAGFQILRTDYRFIFPAALRSLRPVEDLVRALPLGAQYQVLCGRL
jgi:SAM-dependent methyltransferase